MLDKNLTFGGVFFMSKYSNEFKLEVVQYYLKNKEVEIMDKKQPKFVSHH